MADEPEPNPEQVRASLEDAIRKLTIPNPHDAGKVTSPATRLPDGSAVSGPAKANREEDRRP